MDFDSELTQIQGALVRADSVTPFKNLLEKDDHEAVKSVVDVLYQILSEKKYLNEDGVCLEYNEVLRRINLFLILNCDLKIIDELVDNDDLGHLIWVTPTIPKYLLINLIWGLHLNTFYCEAIRYCRPKLSLELLRIVTQNIKKHHNLEKSIEYTRSVIPAIYGATNRLLTRKEAFEKFILNGYYESLYELIKKFGNSSTRPNKDKWSTNRLLFHAGKTLLHLLQMAIDCFNIFLNKPEKVMSKDYDLYFLTYDTSRTEKMHDVDSIINSLFLKFNDVIFSTITEVVKAVNVDVYCSWSEHPFNNDPHTTLQKVIGESAYNLYNILISDCRFNSDVASLLLPISLRPVELADIIKDADRLTMLQKSKEPLAQQKEWLTALSRKEYLFSDIECMDCVCSNAELLTDNVRRELFEKGIDFFVTSGTSEHNNSAKNLTLTCFTLFNIEYKRITLWNVFADKPLGSWLEAEDFDVKFIEVLNKFTTVNEEMTSVFLDFFVQSPYKLYTKVLERCAKNSHALHLLDVLEIFRDMYSIMFVDFHPDMKNVLEVSGINLLVLYALKEIQLDRITTDVEKFSFEQMIQEIVQRNIIPVKVVVTHYLMKEIDNLLLIRGCQYCLLFVRCLRTLFEAKLLVSDVGPILVRLGQILETSRWNLSDYTSSAVELVHTTIEFQKKLLRHFIETYVPSSKEYVWVTMNLKFLSPINFFYYQEILPLRVYKPLIETSYSCKVLSFNLCYLLPRSTLDEWKSIYTLLNTVKSGVSLFQIFCDTLIFISSTAARLNSTTAYACLEYCCFNLAVVLKDMVLPLNSEEDKEKVLCEFVNFVNSLPIEAQNRSFYSFFIPISALLETYNLDTSQDGKQKFENVTNIIENINDQSFKEKLRDLLGNET
ncbi:uncharacterized protein LOC143913455 [Arctopsyche grandis]|uniref:uncharacterized protein LOC143913455 n=1 Tax=Arctopsyche grandis TaxID=121162 RepID=UPI00406D8093